MTNKDNTLECIRNGLRNEITFNRKKQRYLKISRNRSTLGELCSNQNIKEFVEATAKQLRKKSLNIQKYRQLQNVLIQSENYISIFFQVNAIQGLSRDLSGISIQSKLGAANCCCNLSLGNSKACIALCKSVAPYLITDLESTNQPLAEVCAWTIGNLVSGNNKVFSILHAQGCMKAFIKIAQQCSDTLLSAVSYASLRYIYTGSDLIEISDITTLASIMIKRYSDVSDINTLWLLAILSSQSKCNEDFMKCIFTIYTDFYKSIFREDENIEKISAILRIICNVVTESSGKVAFCLFTKDMETNILLKQLLFHQYIHIRQETLWLLGNLYNHSLDSVQQMGKIIISALPSLTLVMNSLNQTI